MIKTSLAILAIFAASTASAVPVTFNFEATANYFSSSGDTTGLLDHEPTFATNNVFTGSFTYELDQIPTSDNTRNARFEGGPSSISASFPTVDVTFDTEAGDDVVAYVVYNTFGGLSRDGLVFGGGNDFPRSGRQVQTYFQIDLSSSFGDVFKTASLPDTLDISDFKTNRFSFQTRTLDFGASTHLVGQHFISGQLTKLELAPISTIPLPAAGWMLFAGVAGLGLMRRKRTVL